MEGDQSSPGPQSPTPQSPTAPEDPETKIKKNSVISSMENQVSFGGSSSTSNNSQARSYECIFCKRGFANAQALGGHMNIHRKDKEKLKHNYHVTSSIDQTARHMDRVIPRMIQHRPQAPPSAPPVVSWGNWMIQDEGKKAEVKGRNDDNQSLSKSGEVRKLPLFIDQPLNKMDREEQRSAGDRQDAVPTSKGCEVVEKENSSSEGHGSSEVSTVDLELRLGPEPLNPSSQPLSTRKFF